LSFDAVIETHLGIFGGGAVLGCGVIAALGAPDIEAVFAGGEKIGLFGARQIVGHGNAGDSHADPRGQCQPIPLHTPPATHKRGRRFSA